MSEDQAVRSRKSGRSFFRINVRTMMILVATSSLVVWSARRVWEDSTQNPFIRVLQFGDTADRRMAARELIATPRPGEGPKVVDALILALCDEDAEVRAASANSLGSVVGQLLDGWKSNPADLRTNQPLINTTCRALIGLLKERNDTVKSEVLRALVFIHYRATPPTNNTLPVSFCLGLDSSDKALTLELRAAIATSLSEQNPEIRGLAAWALEHLGPFLTRDIPPELVDALNDPMEEVRQKAARACTSYKEGLSPLVPDLFARLDRAQPAFRFALRLCLREGTADPSLVPFLRERLKSPSPDVRECAAGMLARMGPKAVAATPDLLAVLNEPFTEEKPKRMPYDQPDPASYAVWALSNFPPTPEFIDSLARNLQSESPWRRDRAVQYLAPIGPAARKAIPALIAALQAHLRSNLSDAGNVSVALGKIAPGTDLADASIAVLVDALRSNDQYTRWQAAEAIGRFGPKAKDAVPALRGLMKDQGGGDVAWNLNIRNAAGKALEAIEPAPGPSDGSPK
jgi:HEAT repeat protein